MLEDNVAVDVKKTAESPQFQGMRQFYILGQK